jgi:hypothetical protein
MTTPKYENINKLRCVIDFIDLFFPCKLFIVAAKNQRFGAAILGGYSLLIFGTFSSKKILEMCTL